MAEKRKVEIHKLIQKSGTFAGIFTDKTFDTNGVLIEFFTNNSGAFALVERDDGWLQSVSVDLIKFCD